MSSQPQLTRTRPGTAVRHSKTAVLVRIRDPIPYPYRIVRRFDGRVLSQYQYLLDALEAWAMWYARP